MEEIAELSVEEHDHVRRVMKLAKTFLLTKERLNIISGTNSSPVATRASENLVRFGYVTIENIQTKTEVRMDRRFIKLIITVKKTPDFKKIYDENEIRAKRRRRKKQRKTRR